MDTAVGSLGGCGGWELAKVLFPLLHLELRVSMGKKILGISKKVGIMKWWSWYVRLRV